MTTINVEKLLLGRPPRRRYSREEKKSILAAWETSGLSKAQFCKKHNMATSAFYNWQQNFQKPEREKEKSKNLDWWQLNLPEAPKEPKLIDFTLNLSNGTILKMKMLEEKLFALIKEICHATSIVR